VGRLAAWALFGSLSPKEPPGRTFASARTIERLGRYVSRTLCRSDVWFFGEISDDDGTGVGEN